MKIIDKLKLWARLCPPPSGPLPDGLVGDSLLIGLDKKFALVLIDERGRVFQIEAGAMHDCEFRQVENGRTAITDLLDELDVQDMPKFS